MGTSHNHEHPGATCMVISTRTQSAGAERRYVPVAPALALMEVLLLAKSVRIGTVCTEKAKLQ